ncbi:hypothetical protein HanXRQr2_Chr14g0631841 [Helianthus annuus]|uniref:Spen paralogue and orthologue SPOC C-terminal domain-containing protein n=1 Tax=Helianthus annuus TaxID=4232 RepID=A0A9K3E8S9_HELAN|nr:hypothetical protein HanXRQr2_Chr14g0631841 [Helianthus annuus]KAJ0839377.1 hypothetical protein HanPSC8_Chr14g0606091 [Helianthus annuus]
MLVVFLSESGLDTISLKLLIAQHYTDAVGFDIVSFLPDSEEDFASYTEFVRYLGDRNRAGVAKFDDGTTLFLVPPSEFLSEVLNVSGPERLYGVVLNGEKVLQFDYSGVPHDDLKSNPKSTGPSHNPLAPPPPPTAVSAPTLQTGLALTPELIATLASLAKGNFNDQQPSAVGPPNERPPWEYEPELSNNTFHGQPPILPGHQGYQSNMVNNAHLTASGNFPPMQDYSFGMPQHDGVPSPMPQSGQFAVPVQPNQQYLPNIPQETHPGSVLQAGANRYGANVYQPQRPENPGMQLPLSTIDIPEVENATHSPLRTDKNQGLLQQALLELE